jgi:hypothetical protein
MGGINMATSKNKYITNGVYVNPAEITVGDKVRLSYDGILAKSGANEIFAHVGYGTKWNDAQYVKMAKTLSGFEATIPVTQQSPLNVCFKDPVDNWDNNSGKNYIFDVVS